MDRRRKWRINLYVVAFLFMGYGIHSVISVSVLLFHSHVSLDPGILALLVAPGLLRRSQGWRYCALFLLVLNMIMRLPVALFLFINPGPLNFGFAPHVSICEIDKWIGALILGLLYAITLWAFRVLTHQEVKSLFRMTPETQE